MSNIIQEDFVEEKQQKGNVSAKTNAPAKVSKKIELNQAELKIKFSLEKRHEPKVDSLQKLLDIKSEVIAKDRKVQSDNTILVQDYDKNGEPHFSVAEILDSKKGIYIILNTGKIVCAEPFTGKTGKNINITYYPERGGKPETHEREASYEHLPRKDKVVYSKLYHFLSSEVTRIYTIKENFRHETDNEKFYSSTNLEIEGWGFLKHPFVAKYIDKMGILSSKTASVEKWLIFENEFNAIFKHHLHTGKNYLKEDEWKVIKELDKVEAENAEMRNKFNKAFNIKQQSTCEK